MAELPFVAVFTAREVKGIDHLEPAGERERCTALPLDLALAETWKTDAHIQPVFPWPLEREDIEEGWPRFNVPVLPHIRKLGHDLLMQVFFFDVDNSPHVPHTVETFEDFFTRLDKLPPRLTPAYVFTTKKGARLVYVLDQPLKVDDAEPAHRGFAEVLRTAGMPVDPECASNWTRLYRAPRVLRDDERTEDFEFFRLLAVDEDARLDAESIPKRGTAGRAPMRAVIADWEGNMPTPEDAEALLHYGGKDTDFYKQSRLVLKHKGSGPIIFEGQRIAPEGNRDNTLYGLVRQVFRELRNSKVKELATPPRVFALLLKPVQQLKPDRDTPDWVANLWMKCCREWRDQEAEEAAASNTEPDAESIGELVTRMRKFYPMMPEGEWEASVWLTEHAIAVLPGRRFSVLRPNGEFSRAFADSSQLHPALRERKTDRLIDIWKANTEGKKHKRRVDELCQDYGTHVNDIRYDPRSDHCFIENPDTDHATLIVPAYQLKPWDGVYNDLVDTWLRELAGDQYDLLEKWLVRALDFRAGPICALSLSGPPSIGKKLLVQGLVECITTEACASELDFGDYQTEALLKTCFLSIDEEMPSVKRLSGVFRRFVSGEGLRVNVKYMPVVEVRNPMRIIITANHQDMIHDLCGGRQLSAEDQQALALRILHLDRTKHSEAADFLADLGGLSFTARDGQRWIEGDAGQPSDYIVAKHFMWLYQNRDRAPLGRRLLMEGNVQELLMKQMRTQGGVAPDVLATLAWMIESKDPSTPISVDERKGIVCVSANGVIDIYNRQMRTGSAARLNHKNVATALEGISEPYSENPVYLQWRNGQKQKARWRRINIKELLDYTMEVGLPNERLQLLVEQKEALA